ncbi:MULTISPECIES: VOC family protein [unclassified Rathayibacter]|uniref:VOC family protein n=1 Tax=unclassified Rathayibacter TaxID=2609250 RepID=UPI000F4CCB55|nr:MULTISPECIES: VOC family protein [unclassified Rathayibacter]ROP45302.1 catechol 2,3-dioxygenase-like lactoylglutathione lyase family enzyme [Rathayibacter sp. PhB186]ROS25044.1 catechol 2,3-dioxygenase-like lactoylglutathione lyase family enzyme [Rathayibacter sp. PhB127]ROS48210.1 catechol 2,3-dioxygenase-like lactoylglutathione lyase family enzyme [Rathayibacter sp. PhB185]TCL78849.1 catechol 2,3-dioxygenase-like lactoylglutathione lyase family enzyme [Rathayibacter sp. PhB192]TCM24985.1
MAGITAFDHVGVTVHDLETATAFFVGLGLVLEGRAPVEGEFLDTVVGMQDARTDIVMLRPPGGGTAVELSRFVRPAPRSVPAPVEADEPGLRSLAFVVDDLAAVLERLAADGYGLVGGVGEYEGVWRMAYVRGPEGVIVALSERLA